MGFIRSFQAEDAQKLTSGENATLYGLLLEDIRAGLVFPAVRVDELYFYYKGGCLYRFSNGAFRRDTAYERHSGDTTGLSPYERAKKQNENKYKNVRNGAKERQLLDCLYAQTFGEKREGNVVVLDIEVNLNGMVGGGRKCDLVLYNTQSGELMFVEGKVFSDPRVKVKRGRAPEVINQVQLYAASIEEQRETIVLQYGEHVRIINELFGTDYRAPKKVILPAKLLVYETDAKTDNGAYSVGIIEECLGIGNVLWAGFRERPALDEIWERLCS